MIDIIIKDFPMPISVNQALMPIIGKIKRNKFGKIYGAGRFVKSDKYKDYETACLRWEISHKPGLERLKHEILLRRAELAKEKRHLTLRLQYFAVFPHEKIS